MSNKILTIDQGTTSSRAIIFNISGDIEHISQEEYPLIYPEDGWVEIDVNVLEQSVLTTIKKVPLDDVLSIGITNQRETTIVWDRKTGIPIYNAIVWQDRRTAAYCESVDDPNIRKKIKNKTGLLMDPYFSATKIKWILDNVPNAKTKAQNGELCFGTVDSYLMYKFSNGKIFKTDITNASRTLLFNINDLQWDEELINFFDIPRGMLPEVENSDTHFGELEQINNLPVKAVLGDQHAALFGQGCLNKGNLKSTYGTGCFLMVNVGDIPVLSDEGLLTTIGFSLNGNIYYAIEGSIYSAGSSVQWLRDNMKFFNESHESESYLDPGANSNGVHFIPAFTGLGAPYWNSNIRASYHGLTRNTSREDLITATFNSISYQTKDIVECLSKAGVNINSLNIDGGMVTNKIFCKQLSTLLDMELHIPSNKESTARGVAVLAGINSKIMTEKHVLDQDRSICVPDNDNKKLMIEDYKKWRAIIKNAL
ncbi:glycerol kinase GlpK [Gammaproteobacteria bacterium]|nr:glycerol kinase GlpK [Gammaproteobacteria bacterium]